MEFKVLSVVIYQSKKLSTIAGDDNDGEYPVKPSQV